METCFYIRSGDYLVENLLLTPGRNKECVYIDNIPTYTEAIIISNAIRKHYNLPEYDYSEYISCFSKAYNMNGYYRFYGNNSSDVNEDVLL